MGKIFITSILWLASFFLNGQAYSIYSYYGIWISLIASLIIIVSNFQKFIAVFRFRPDKDNYDFSGMKFILRNGHNIVGVIIFIMGAFYQTIDLGLRVSSIFSEVKNEILEERSSDTLNFGMVTINHFKYKNGNITYQLNVPTYSSDLNELIIYNIDNLDGDWRFKSL